MSTHVRAVLMSQLDSLRHEPIEKRIRATMGDATVVDTLGAMLVWEPRRVVPSYAIPDADIDAEITSAAVAERANPVCDADAPQLAGRPVLDPRIPFAVHTAAGEPVIVRVQGSGREAAGFRAADPELAGHVIVDFGDFDAWYEEDERNVSHPRDPFHRIDFVHSSRRVRVERDGEVLAESSRPVLVFEPPLPVRYYLPPEDVRTDLFTPSDHHSWCAYKGQASYWSVPGFDNVAWYYPAPLREAGEVQDRIAFFDEHVDVIVDGRRSERPVTPWSRR
jgi:uncharacterized protein (DUF427 family)